jgi:eukaryotic-like serine/threonine-protein kinase
MTPERWQQIKEIFHSALDHGQGERSTFLAQACGGDESLRSEVESLLSSHEQDGGFIDAPAYEIAAGLLAENQSTIQSGQKLGSYRILSTLGRGGMGDVYLAEDVRLGRKVALKLLPSSFTNDSQRLRRFEREARAASGLNHPNILTIHEIGQAEDRHFIATELVEGENLRKLASGTRMNMTQMLDVGEQVAGALMTAHAAGIVHRDIKPENIMVRPDGLIKILDFGLAKMPEQPATTDVEAAISTMNKTEPGMMIGTPRYMSPEQARGDEVDFRSDIWSLGCVLYEMVTGRAPFDGSTTSHVIVSILEKEPSWHDWPSGETSAELEWIVRKSLRKEREDRYQSAKEVFADLKSLNQRLGFAAELERTTPGEFGKGRGVSAATNEIPTLTTSERVTNKASWIDSVTSAIKHHRGIVAVALVTLAVATVFAIYKFAVGNKPASETETKSGPAETASVLKATQVTTWSGLDFSPSLSPDGNSVAYSSDRSGSFEIFVKQLAPGGREIQITSDGGLSFEPAWSPDGKLIAFHSKSRGGIWVVPALGGTSRQLTEFGSYPAWSPDGSVIAFQSSGIGDDLASIGSGALTSSTIWTVSTLGGLPNALTQVGKPPGGHAAPSWSPDGKWLVFGAVGLNGETRVWSMSAKGGQLRQIVNFSSFDPIFSPDGKAIYFAGIERGFTFGLWKVRISSDSGEPIGDPIRVADTGPARIKRLSVSADGKKLAYTALLISSNLWSVPITSVSGEAVGPPIPLTQETGHRNSSPDFSPDGRKIAYSVTRVGTSSDIWLMDADGKHPTQLTTDPGHDTGAVWFPDGERIAFVSSRSGRSNLWVTTLNGVERILLDLPQDWSRARLSPDGKQLAFNSREGGTINVWTVAIGGGTPRQLTFDKEFMGFPSWSPDGKSLAFEMKRGDDVHVVIMPSNGGEAVQLTFDQGQSWPHSFSPDGDKIAFAGFRNGFWNVWWVSRSTKVQKQVTNNSKSNAFVRYPSWSPLGNQIVYEYAETSGNIWLVELK